MTTEVQYVHPSELLANANSRFGLKRARIETMKANILAQEGILVPLEVEPLTEASNGHKYLITDGHYRHAAATELAKEHDDMVCPIIVKSSGETPVDRLKRQTAFNYEREGLSPMDMGVAGKSLLDAGVSRQDIRALFSRPGGRKGAKVQPLSNSMLNIYMSFLDFPKDIQKKIHEGVIPVGPAMSLMKKPRDKWADIVAQCEADRADEAEAEVELEAKFEADEAKRVEDEAKAKKLAEEAEAAKVKAAEAAKLKQEKIDAEQVALAKLRATEGEDKKAAEEALKAAGADVKAAIATVEESNKASQKAEAALVKYNEAAEARKKKLEALRKGVTSKPISDKEIEKASKKVTGDGVVKLNANDMRRAVEEWMLPGGNPKVQAIATIIMKCFNSELTNQQAYKQMAAVTGEEGRKPRK